MAQLKAQVEEHMVFGGQRRAHSSVIEFTIFGNFEKVLFF